MKVSEVCRVLPHTMLVCVSEVSFNKKGEVTMHTVYEEIVVEELSKSKYADRNVHLVTPDAVSKTMDIWIAKGAKV